MAKVEDKIRDLLSKRVQRSELQPRVAQFGTEWIMYAPQFTSEPIIVSSSFDTEEEQEMFLETMAKAGVLHSIFSSWSVS